MLQLTGKRLKVEFFFIALYTIATEMHTQHSLLELCFQCWYFLITVWQINNSRFFSLNWNFEKLESWLIKRSKIMDDLHYSLIKFHLSRSTFVSNPFPKHYAITYMSTLSIFFNLPALSVYLYNWHWDLFHINVMYFCKHNCIQY